MCIHSWDISRYATRKHCVTNLNINITLNINIHSVKVFDDTNWEGGEKGGLGLNNYVLKTCNANAIISRSSQRFDGAGTGHLFPSNRDNDAVDSVFVKRSELSPPKCKRSLKIRKIRRRRRIL